MAKFKVGDKVVLARILTGDGTSYNIGDSAYITDEFINYNGEHTYMINDDEEWSEDELDLYVEEKEPEAVKVVDSNSKEIEVGFVPKTKFDEVNKAEHYNQGKYEVIDVLKDWLTKEEFIGFCRGNTLKYVARYQKKGGVKDLQKAEYYNNKLMEALGEK